MRVAQRMVSRNYRKTLNNSLAKQAGALERSESGLKFKKLSDNVADGTRAMHLQEERYRANQQKDNAENLYAESKSVDSNLSSIHSILQTAQERMLMGMSEDYGASARAVIAKEIASKKDQVLQFANAQFGGKNLFSGTNNSQPPFTVNDDGKLAFNGIQVDQIYRKDGKYVYDVTEEVPKLDGGGNPVVDGDGNPVMETVVKETLEVPNSEHIFADVGLGLKITGDVQADPRTAYKVSFSGLEFMGCPSEQGQPTVTGKKGNEVPTNLYDLMTEIESALSPEMQKEKLDDLFTQLVDMTDQVGMVRTDLGTRMQFLEDTVTRLDNDITNMTELETDLVSSDPAEEAMKMKECEYVWLAVMQLGSKVLPASLLDFMS